MNGIPMGDVLPGIIGEVKCHQGKLVQTPLPYILSAVGDLPMMFEGLFLPRRRRNRDTSAKPIGCCGTVAGV